ncbi:MAG TPA: HAD-IIIC family phosphatase [Solirubrobacteraceae bacterium]|nr:HAD-IIIC family phosphatase [Solirubrobacteraceae bacterium]
MHSLAANDDVRADPGLAAVAAPVSDEARLNVSVAVGANIENLVELWFSLREAGPLYEAATGDPGWVKAQREGYLQPMALLLRDALSGSRLHRSLYLDMRPWHLQDLRPGDRPAAIAQHLPKEVAAIAALLDRPETESVLAELHAPLLNPPAEDAQRLLLIGDCIMPEVRVFLAGHERPLQSAHVQFHADFRGFRPEAVAAQIERMRPSLIGLSLFSHNATPVYSALRNDAPKLNRSELSERVAQSVEQLATAIQAIRAVTDAPILVHSPAAISLSRRDQYLPTPRGLKRMISEMEDQIAKLVAASENVIQLRETEVAERIGGRRAAGKRLLSSDYREAWFHPMRIGPALAEEYEDVLASLELVQSTKAVFVDFDNTLWNGVMAEGPVVHNREGQKLLKELRKAGVLLIALSKNDPANIRWDEMELAPEDFVLHKISWRPKPEGAAEAIHELDLAAKAFLLLDDNPAERALVEENVAGVRAIDPADPFAWRTLQRWLASPSTKATPEALKRTEMYREAAERRRALGTGTDYRTMLTTLELAATVREATDADMDRLLELVQRTNQFNTTTRRRSRAELTELMRSPNHRVIVAGLRDRFGDLGVVGVVIADYTSDDSADVDSFVMSCRAMGFGLEFLLLNQLTSDHPDRRWTGSFLRTDRNGPASELFGTAGFDCVEGDPDADVQLWALQPDAPRPERPSWFLNSEPTTCASAQSHQGC